MPDPKKLIERELDFLDQKERTAKHEYDCKVKEIEVRRKKLMKQFRKITREEAKRYADTGTSG